MADLGFQYTVSFDDINKARDAMIGLNDAQKQAIGHGKQFEDAQVKGSKSVAKEAKEAEKGVNGLGQAVKALAAAAAIFAAASWFKSAAEKVDRDRVAAAKLEAVLKATGNQLNRSTQSLLNFADALEKSTRFSGDQIVAAQAVQATFRQIDGSMFDEVTTTAADLATVLGSDLQSAVLQLGKALEDPAKGVSALSRSGVSFSEEQQHMIKALVDSNRHLEAQRIVLDQVKVQVDGAAVAVGRAGTGAWHQAGVAVDDFQKSIGKLIVDGFKPLAGWLSETFKILGRYVAAFSKMLGLNKTMNQEIEEQQVQYGMLFHQLKNVNAELDKGVKNQTRENLLKKQKRELLGQINSQYGDYLPNLLNEKTSIEDINKAQQVGLRLMTQQLVVRARQQELEEAMTKAMEYQRKLNQLEAERAAGRSGILGIEYQAAQIVEARRARDNYIDIIDDLQNVMAKEQSRLEMMFDKSGKSMVKAEKDKNKEIIVEDKEAAKERERIYKQMLENRKKFREETDRMEQNNYVSSIQDKYQAEMAKLQIARDRMLAEAKMAGITEEEQARRVDAVLEDYRLKSREAQLMLFDGALLGDTDKAVKSIERIGDVGQLTTTQLLVAFNGLADAYIDNTAEMEEASKHASERILTHYAGIANDIASLFGDLAINLTDAFTQLAAVGVQNQLQALDAQIDRLGARISEQDEDIQLLNEAAAAASGTRRDELKQEANIKSANVAQERTALEALEQRKKQLAVEQAKRDKASAIAAAIINTAQGITQVLATTPTVDFGIARAILIATTLAAGTAQVAAIAAQPLPQFKMGGEVPVKRPSTDGLLLGKPHTRGGIPIEAEGGEWIFSREKTQQFRPLFEAIQAGQLTPRINKVVHAHNPSSGTLDISPLTDVLRGLKQVHVNIDEKGFRVAEQKGRMKETYLNARYKA